MRRNQVNMKKRDAIMRGEPIKIKRPGRPKMTSSEKEAAREKRRQELKNAVPYDSEKMKESRPETSAAAATAVASKRKYNKKSSQDKAKQPKFQVVVNEQGNAVGKKDQFGNFIPYKKRGRSAKNLATKQTGFSSPHICGGSRGLGKGAMTSPKKTDKLDIQLEDMLQNEMDKKQKQSSETEPAVSKEEVEAS